MLPVGAVMTIMETSWVVRIGTTLILWKVKVLPQWELEHGIIA